MDRVDRWTLLASRRDVVRGAAGLALATGIAGLSDHPLWARSVQAESALLVADESELKDLEIPDLVKKIRSSKFSQANIDAAIEALARAGIPVFAEAAASEPIVAIDGEVSPLRFLEWQVRSMALEVSTRGGSLGAELDLLYPVEEGFPAISSWLGGYAASAPSPGGEIAQAIMGNRNWKNADDASFPLIVQALFSSDVAMESDPTGAANANSLWAQTSACGGMQDFVDSSIANALDYLNQANGAEPGHITNHTIEELRDLGTLNPDNYEAEVVEVMRQAREVAAMLAIASEAISLVRPWAVRVGANPKETRFGIGQEVIQGSVTAWVDFGGTVDWPGDLVSCAAESGLSLPPLSAKDAPIEWVVTEKPIPLVEFNTLPGTLDGDGQAAMQYVTLNEESAEGEEQEGRVTVKATVQRDDLAEAGRVIFSAIMTKLERFAMSPMGMSFANRISEIEDQFLAISKGTGMGVLTVVYHDKEQKKKESNNGIDKKLVGSWQLTDVSAALTDQLAQNDFGGPPMYFEGQHGTQIYHFSRDGVIAVNSDGFTAVGGSDDPFMGHVDVGMEYTGTVGGTYSADGNAMKIEWDDFSGMSVRLLMTINGSALPGGNVGEPQRYFPMGTVPYEISGNTLKLWMYGQNSVPVVLTRV